MSCSPLQSNPWTAPKGALPPSTGYVRHPKLSDRCSASDTRVAAQSACRSTAFPTLYSVCAPAAPTDHAIVSHPSPRFRAPAPCTDPAANDPNSPDSNPATRAQKLPASHAPQPAASCNLHLSPEPKTATPAAHLAAQSQKNLLRELACSTPPLS